MYEKPNFENTEIISVNYNTPELLENLLTSIRLFYPEKPQIRIIDGSDKYAMKQESINVIKNYPNTLLQIFGYNIHHGPGMNYAITTSNYKYLWILDTDTQIIKDGIIEHLFTLWREGLYSLGGFSYVNKFGVNPKRNADKFSILHPYLYCHPNGIFLEKATYLKYFPFVKHGAPVIGTMINLHEKGLSNKLLKNVNYIYKEYLDMGGRGTVKKFGYNL